MEDPGWRDRFEQETGRSPEDLAHQLHGRLPVDPLFDDHPHGTEDTEPGSWPFSRGATAEPRTTRSCPRIDPTRSDAVALVEEAAALGARAFWVDGDPTAALSEAIARTGGELVADNDPLGDLVRLGAREAPLEEAIAEAVREAMRPDGRPLVASGLPYDDSGASGALQLAFAASTAVFYTRRLTEAGLPFEDAADRIGFRLAAGADVPAAIAFFRAARIVWAKVRAVSGATGSIARLHVVSSARESARRDPWVNILRGTSHAFAAITAGADLVTVAPFDEPVRRPNSAARRLALNTVSVLNDECFAGAVVDPAGGAYAIEQLTDRFARAAWVFLRAIEIAGGMREALLSGEVRRLVDESWDAREDDLASRRLLITGVSGFADPDEAALDGDPPPSPPPAGADFPFPRRRDDDAYHTLRTATDELAAASSRPIVHLANLGPAAEHRPRTAFATSFLKAGGFDVDESPSAGDRPAEEAAATLAESFAGSGAAIACLCGSDGRYDSSSGAVAGALREAGATVVLLVAPPDGRKGIADDFLFPGCDAPRVLGALLERLMAGRSAR